MNALQSIVLGIVQGLGEFLPISSSAHLILVPWFFKWKDPGLSFDVALHGGTLIALIIYFRKDVGALITGGIGWLGGKREYENNLSFSVALATVPAMIAGLLLEHLADEKLRSPLLIAATLAGIAIVMGLVDRKADSGAPLTELTVGKAVLIGCAQCLALIPGVSRSGITIITALLIGLDRPSAVKFSFLLSVPIITGAVLLKMGQFIHHAGDVSFWMGLSAAALSGYAAINFLVTYVRTKRLTLFVVYRIALAVVVVAWAFK